ncbi:MAG: hypothetical protein LBL04_13380, partial [Bacteroidales bacterium]|nr:hypothetical protein [Bacteroidales bacterium]
SQSKIENSAKHSHEALTNRTCEFSEVNNQKFKSNRLWLKKTDQCFTHGKQEVDHAGGIAYKRYTGL